MRRHIRFALLSLALTLVASDCPEGDSLVPSPPILGTVQGTIRIDGQPAPGVNVTLSTGQTATTDGAGQYSIPDVGEGVHTATISGFPSDVTFPQTSKAFSISTQNQTTVVDFTGSRTRSSAIVGTATLDGEPFVGVTVSVTDPDGFFLETVTNATGGYAFPMLATGPWVVTIAPPSDVTCEPGAHSFTLGVGETRVANFACESDPPSTAALPGIYDATLNLTSSTGSCPSPLGGSDDVEVTNPDGNEVEIRNLDPDVDLAGEYDPETGQYTAQGSTSLANRITIQSQLDGTFEIQDGEVVFRGTLVRVHKEPDGSQACREEYEVEFRP